jgi:hypothetical protein
MCMNVCEHMLRNTCVCVWVCVCVVCTLVYVVCMSVCTCVLRYACACVGVGRLDLFVHERHHPHTHTDTHTLLFYHERHHPHTHPHRHTRTHIYFTIKGISPRKHQLTRLFVCVGMLCLVSSTHCAMSLLPTVLPMAHINFDPCSSFPRAQLQKEQTHLIPPTHTDILPTFVHTHTHNSTRLPC